MGSDKKSAASGSRIPYRQFHFSMVPLFIFSFNFLIKIFFWHVPPQVYPFGDHSDSYIYRFMSFTKFGELYLLFLQILFQPHFFYSPSGNLKSEYWIICDYAIRLCLCIFFSSLFSLLFRFDKFYYSVFKFTNLPSVISTPLLNSVMSF